MTGYGESVLNNSETRLLVVAPNWLGDGIMAMPAVQCLRGRLHPGAELLVAARPGQCGLWEMQPAVSRIIPLPATNRELFSTASALKKLHCTAAVILPHSFRSALLTALAGIPCRRGTVIQFGRHFLIQDPVDLSGQANLHQQWEIARLLLPGTLPDSLPAPSLQAPAEASLQAQKLLSALPRPLLGCIPGAARGPSKQWPGERFQAVAEEWIQKTGGGVCWLGTPADAELCGKLNAACGAQGLSLAGKTSLKTFAALLAVMDRALVNDSGGMHLAAAMGTSLVALFGTTDPSKTGPLSEKAVVLQQSEIRKREISRNSREAGEALARIRVERVLEAVLANLEGES